MAYIKQIEPKNIKQFYNVSPPKETSLFILNLSEPAVFHGYISKWKCRLWTPEFFGRELAQLSTRFRFFPRSKSPCLEILSSRPVMETDCDFQEGTFHEFYSWLKGDETGAGKLARFSKTNYWCYADYKYMSELFKDFPELLTAVDWSVFGFDGRDGRQSTIWIGSDGASTSCHMDTYGCNLVAQIYGKKKWTLFSPNDQHKLYPSRIPYEESSVFSQVNVTSPDLNTYPEFSEAEKYEVILNPGDVLFVPKHWWHFVESLEPSISINSWIELESDCLDRVQEAVTRILVCNLKLAEATPFSTWLNPTEEVGTFHQNLEYLQNSLSEVHKCYSSASLKGSNEECSSSVITDGDQEPKIGTEVDTDTLVNCLTLPPVVEMISEQLIKQCRRKTKNSKVMSSNTNQNLLKQYEISEANSSSEARLVPSVKRKHQDGDS